MGHHPRLRGAPHSLVLLGLKLKEMRKWGYCSNLKYGRGYKNVRRKIGH